MFNNLNIEENTRYETLVTTLNRDNSHHIKPMGVVFKKDTVILNIYPNNTLKNIKENNSFMVQLTYNPLMFTKALLDLLEADDFENSFILKDVSYVLYADVSDYVTLIKEDSYGKTVLTRIEAKITDVVQVNNMPSVLNRTTNKILELLVKLSRIRYMNKSELSQFDDEIEDSLRFIVKEGNQNHINCLTLIKKQVKNRE